MVELHNGESIEKENGGITTSATFMDTAGLGGENVLHVDKQGPTSDVFLVDERIASLPMQVRRVQPSR